MFTAIVSFFTLLGGILKFLEGKEKEKLNKIKETKDAIKNGDTSTITSNLS